MNTVQCVGDDGQQLFYMQCFITTKQLFNMNNQVDLNIFHLFIFLQENPTGLQNNTHKFHIIQMSQDNWLRIHNISQEYKIIEKVGRGTYGTVYKAKHLKTGNYVAIKKIQNKDPKLQIEGFPITALREINLLKIMNHKNVIKMKQIIVSKPQKKNLLRGSTFLIFQYMDHDFAGLFRHHIKFTLPQIKCLLYQILQGVKYLHDCKILHRDIKSANLLLNSKGEVKIADFGLGRKFRSDFQYTSKVVTLWYRAPQLLLGTKQYSEKIDVWSVGCILAEFIIGEVLFKKQTEYSQIQKIYEVLGGLQQNNFHEAKNYAHYNDLKPKKPYPKQLTEYIKRIYPDLDQVTSQFLNGLLQINPKNRLSTEDALNHRFFHEAPLACKPAQIPKFTMEYHEIGSRAYQKIQKNEQKNQDIEQFKKPAKYFENERKYSYQSKQYKKDYDKQIKDYSYKERQYKDQKDYGIKQYKEKQYKDKDYKDKQYKQKDYTFKGKDFKKQYQKDDRKLDFKYENKDKEYNSAYKRINSKNQMEYNKQMSIQRQGKDVKIILKQGSSKQYKPYNSDIKNDEQENQRRDKFNRVEKNYEKDIYKDKYESKEEKQKYQNKINKYDKQYNKDSKYEKEKYDNGRYQNWSNNNKNDYNKNRKFNNNMNSNNRYDYHNKEVSNKDYDKQYRQKDYQKNYYKDSRQYGNKDYERKLYSNKYRKDNNSKQKSGNRSKSRSFSKSRSKSKSHSRSRSRQNQTFSYSWKNTNHK